MMTMSAHKRIRIEHDEFPESPRAWCNLGTMVCWHNLYSLGDEQPSEDPDEYLLAMAEEFSPGITERVERFADRLWEDLKEREGLTLEDRLRSHGIAVDAYQAERVLAVLDRHVIMLPLYLMDHSGLSMNTGGFSCPWDSGQVGYIYAKKADIRKEYGWKLITAKRQKQIESYLKGEVEVYDQHLRGDVWGFVIEEFVPDEGWQETDSCWGFYGSDPFENGMSDHINVDDHVLLRIAADKLHYR